MTKMSTADAAKDFAGVLRRVAAAHERIVFQADGKSVAALVPVEDLRLLEQMLALLEQYEDSVDLADTDDVLSSLVQEGVQDWTDVKEKA